jgi:Flp pilus assembly protein TadD
MALLFVSVVGVFLPCVQNDFVGYDDPLYVTFNSHVQEGFNRASLTWAASTGEGGNWNPATWVSHLLDVQLFGLQAWGHHLTSILIHAINAALLFGILLSMTGARWRSLVVAAFFGLHPLRVESVAWVAERKDVLSGMFWMLTLWAYFKYASSRTQGGTLRINQQRLRYYFLALLFFALGLMSKPMVVTLPFVLLLLDFWPLQRWQRLQVLLVEKLPFFLLSVIDAVVTLLVQKNAGAIISEASLPHRIGNALVSYWRYISKIFWPDNLAVFYPPVAFFHLGIILLAGLLLLGISWLAVIQRCSRPWLLVGWFWFVGTLVPVIGVVQAGEQSMADRYSYLPSIGMGLIFTWAAFELFRNWSVRQPISLKVGQVTLVSGLVLCAMLTRNQIRYWKDTRTLFMHAAQVTKKNYVAYNNIGVTLDKEGSFQEAIGYFEQAIRTKPNYAEAYNNLGVVLGKLGRSDEAINQFKTASQLKPGYADPHKSLGTILDQLGRNAEAIQEYQIALRIQPNDPDAHNNLGAAYGRAGRTDEAIVEFQKVLQLQPGSADTHNNLGVALDARGYLDQAIQHFLQAVKLKPDYARAHFNLAGALSRKGDLDNAIFEFKEALRLKPDYGAAETNLSLVLQIKAQRRSQ